MKDCPLAFGDNDERRCVWCGDPLKGRQQRWCSASCSGAFGTNHWWTSARHAARKRDGMRCVRCGSQKTIQVHHKEPIVGRHDVTGCHHHLDGLETLCKDCHKAAHHPRPPQMALAGVVTMGDSDG